MIFVVCDKLTYSYCSNENDASLNLHFGNFGTAVPKVEMAQRCVSTKKDDAWNECLVHTCSPITTRPVSSAVSRPAVARPVSTPAPKENKELEPQPVSAQPANSSTLQSAQARKPATRPPEKKQSPQQQPPLRPAPIPAMGMDSGLSDDLAFGQRMHTYLKACNQIFTNFTSFPPPSSLLFTENPHMQINPQPFSAYNPGHFHFMPSGPFALSELDPSANPSLAHQMVREVVTNIRAACVT